jgi:hypothetical protein
MAEDGDDGGFVLTWDAIVSVAPDSVRGLLTNPVTWVLGILYELVVGGAVDAAAAVLSLVTEAFALAATAPQTAAAAVITIGTDAAGAVFELIGTVATSVQGLVSVAGPAAPVVLVLVALAMMWLLVTVIDLLTAGTLTSLLERF